MMRFEKNSDFEKIAIYPCTSLPNHMYSLKLRRQFQ
jgi:hypothetical protein